MKRILFTALTLMIILATFRAANADTAAQTTTTTPATASTTSTASPLQTTQDKLSYSMGVATGKAFKMHGLTINPKAFALGLQHGLTGAKTLMSPQDISNTLSNFQKKTSDKVNQTAQPSGAQNAQEGAAFLAANKSKPGVVTLPSGLQYKIVKAGTGAKPTVNDTVTVDYQGQLINGKVFDSSYKRGVPATFPLQDVIAGWTEGLQLMKTGGTWMFYIPAKLAYGERGAPGAIPPNATLIFKVHLISTK